MNATIIVKCHGRSRWSGTAEEFDALQRDLAARQEEYVYNYNPGTDAARFEWRMMLEIDNSEHYLAGWDMKEVIAK